jgi:hypothetical protein
MTTPLLVVLVALLGAAGWAGSAGRVVVPADHVGIVTRRYGPAHPNPAFKQVNPATARGVPARTLLPGGLNWLTPVMYAVDFVPRVHVPAGMIGLVTAGEAAPAPAAASRAKHLCNGQAYGNSPSFTATSGRPPCCTAST